MISKKSVMNIILILLFSFVLYYIGWTIATGKHYTTAINYVLSITFALLAIKSLNKKVFLIIFSLMALIFMILGITNTGILY